MRYSKFTIATALCLIIPATTVFAQDQRQRRRQFVEDLLKGLIESQLENRNQPARPQPIPNQPNIQPSRPYPRPNTGVPSTGRPTPGRPIVIESSPEMIAVRRELKSLSRTFGDLVGEIRQREYESPRLRPLLADAIKVQANVELLSRKADLYPNIQPLLPDFQLIDSDWRMLSYRLKATGALTTRCNALLKTIEELDQKLCGVFQVTPQVNRRELQRLATMLATDFEHLLNDVYYVSRGMQGSRQLMQQGKQLQTMITQATAMIGRADYDSLVNVYQQCLQQWKVFSRNLHQFRDERLRRSVTQIEDIGRGIQEQLWLPIQLDREYLSHLSATIAEDTGKVFQSVSLASLLNHPSPQRAIAAASEFQFACGGFADSIRTGAPVEELEWDFRLFEVQWNELHQVLHELKIKPVDHQLDDIEFSVGILRQTFGENPGLNYAAIAQMTAELDALCRQTARSVHQLIVQPSYTNNFARNCCNNADRLAASAMSIHQRVLQNPHAQLNRADFDDLFANWRLMKPMFDQCQDNHKTVMNRYLSQIEPIMVKLQVVYAD